MILFKHKVLAYDKIHGFLMPYEATWDWSWTRRQHNSQWLLLVLYLRNKQTFAELSWLVVHYLDILLSQMCKPTTNVSTDPQPSQKCQPINRVNLSLHVCYEYYMRYSNNRCHTIYIPCDIPQVRSDTLRLYSDTSHLYTLIPYLYSLILSLCTQILSLCTQILSLCTQILSLYTQILSLYTQILSLYTQIFYLYTPAFYMYTQILYLYTYTPTVYSDTTRLYSDTLSMHSDTLPIYSDTLPVYSVRCCL